MVIKRNVALFAGAVVLAMACASSAWAKSPAVAKKQKSPGSFANQMSEMNQQQTLLQSQLRIATLEAQLQRIQGRSTGPAAAQAKKYTGSVLPVVSAIIGAKHRYQAILVYPKGIVSASANQRLPNGFRVVSIHRNSVVVSDTHGHRVHLMFANVAGIQGASQNGNWSTANGHGPARHVRKAPKLQRLPAQTRRKHLPVKSKDTRAAH